MDRSIFVRIGAFLSLVFIATGFIATVALAGDPFGTPPAMPQSQRLGGVLLTAARPGDPLIISEKRSIRLLTANEAVSFGVTPAYVGDVFGDLDLDHYYIFANFVSEGFWVAVLPKSSKVNQLLLQVEWFVQGAGAHMQLRFQLDQPILLIPQDDALQKPLSKPLDARGLSPEQRLQLRVPHVRPGDFVYSLLALRSVHGPQDWGPVTGLTGAFGNAFSLQATEHIAQEEVDLNYVEQLPLALPSQAIGQAILKTAIENSSARGETEIYNTVFNSCVTATMQTLFAGGQGLAVDPRGYNPYLVLAQLRVAGLLPASTVGDIPSLNEEFHGRISKSDINQEVKAKIDRAMPLILSPLFDGLVKTIASELANEKWTHAEVISLFQVLQMIPKGATVEEAALLIHVKMKSGELQLPNADKVKSLVVKIVALVRQGLGDFDPAILQLLTSLSAQN